MLRALDADPALRCIVLIGAGEQAFAAGADIAELNALSGAVAGTQLSRRGQELTLLIERMEKPVIAAVNGYALGGGCELAMSADIRIASETARFGQPEVLLGLIPGYGGTQRTTRLLNRGQAMHLCLTGEQIDAQEAFRIGLVQRVVSAATLRDEALRVAHVIAANAPCAISAIKRAIIHGGDIALPAALELEASLFGTLVETKDFREGTQAFLEKRRPTFTGS